MPYYWYVKLCIAQYCAWLCTDQFETHASPWAYPGHLTFWPLPRDGGIWWTTTYLGWGIWPQHQRGGEFDLLPRFYVLCHIAHKNAAAFKHWSSYHVYYISSYLYYKVATTLFWRSHFTNGSCLIHELQEMSVCFVSQCYDWTEQDSDTLSSFCSWKPQTNH